MNGCLIFLTRAFPGNPSPVDTIFQTEKLITERCPPCKVTYSHVDMGKGITLCPDQVN